MMVSKRGCSCTLVRTRLSVAGVIPASSAMTLCFLPDRLTASRSRSRQSFMSQPRIFCACGSVGLVARIAFATMRSWCVSSSDSVSSNISVIKTRTPEGAKVRVTTNQEAVHGCVLVGEVKGADHMNGGLMAQGAAQERCKAGCRLSGPSPDN